MNSVYAYVSLPCFADINECAKGHDCDKEKSLCKITIGSYQCSFKAGFFGDGRTCSGNTYTVEGRVIDASDSSGIRRARVLLGRRSKTTNSNELFSFINVPGLTYTLNASADSYVTNTKEITVTGNIKKDTADIILSKVLKLGKSFYLTFSHIYIFDML